MLAATGHRSAASGQILVATDTTVPRTCRSSPPYDEPRPPVESRTEPAAFPRLRPRCNSADGAFLTRSPRPRRSCERGYRSDGPGERVERRHRLGCAKGDVVADDFRCRPGEPGPGEGVAAVDHGVEGRAVELAGQAEELDTPADPPGGQRAAAGVVLVEAPGDGVDVVLLLAKSLAMLSTRSAPIRDARRRPG